MRDRSKWRMLAVAGLLTLTAAAPVAGQGYRTDAMVPSNGNECRGVPDCSSRIMPTLAVPARGQASARFACPQSHPYIWAWDVMLHEHVGATVVTGDPTSVTIEGSNRAHVDGQLVVSLGCSTRPHDGPSVLTSRHVAPTGWLPGMRRPNAIFPSP